MKRLHSKGIGVQKKQAEPFSVLEEDKLWNEGLLGMTSPQALLDTMIFMCRMYFALRSGKEHRDLQFNQIELIEPTDATPYLVYTENISKNNEGGIAQRKLDSKVVRHHATNIKNPSRCFVQHYKTYISHLPPERKRDAIYLTPLKKLNGNVWYTKTPVGHNKLGRTVSRLCKTSGIPGFKTNHSLHVTAATRLFHSGVDEQLIMSRTGHRSLEGVRAYKRVSDNQKEQVSTVLNDITNGSNPEKKPKLSTHIEHSKSQRLAINLSNSSNITINYNCNH